MEPSTFSIKGGASITYAEKKDNMGASNIWSTLSQIWNYYPEKVIVTITSKRGGSDIKVIDDPLIKSALSDMIGGCIDTCEIKAAIGRSVSLLLGSCYAYKIPMGTRSVDTGHDTMILAVPFPMEGCYTISAKFDGNIKKDRIRQHYMVDMDLDIYIGKLDTAKYEQLLDKGFRVFPFKLRYPKYFQDVDSSDTEATTDASDYDAEEPMKPAHTKRPRRVLNKGIMKPIMKRTRSGVTTKRVLSAIRDLAGPSMVTGEPSGASTSMETSMEPTRE